MYVILLNGLLYMIHITYALFTNPFKSYVFFLHVSPTNVLVFIINSEFRVVMSVTIST